MLESISRNDHKIFEHGNNAMIVRKAKIRNDLLHRLTAGKLNDRSCFFNLNKDSPIMQFIFRRFQRIENGFAVFSSGSSKQCRKIHAYNRIRIPSNLQKEIVLFYNLQTDQTVWSRMPERIQSRRSHRSRSIGKHVKARPNQALRFYTAQRKPSEAQGETFLRIFGHIVDSQRIKHHHIAASSQCIQICFLRFPVFFFLQYG